MEDFEVWTRIRKKIGIEIYNYVYVYVEVPDVPVTNGHPKKKPTC